MERLPVRLDHNIQFIAIAVLLFSLVACGNSGSINFRPDAGKRNSKGIAVTYVPAGHAQTVEFGQTPATGHTAKLQINPTKGTVLTGGGYKVKMKHTVRNR